MGTENAPKKEGKEAGKALRREARQEGDEKGMTVKEGAERFKERAEAAKGKRGVKPAG